MGKVAILPRPGDIFTPCLLCFKQFGLKDQADVQITIVDRGDTPVPCSLLAEPTRVSGSFRPCRSSRQPSGPGSHAALPASLVTFLSSLSLSSLMLLKSLSCHLPIRRIFTSKLPSRMQPPRRHPEVPRQCQSDSLGFVVDMIRAQL